MDGVGNHALRKLLKGGAFSSNLEAGECRYEGQLYMFRVYIWSWITEDQMQGELEVHKEEASWVAGALHHLT